MNLFNRRSLLVSAAAAALGACAAAPVPTDTYYRLAPIVVAAPRAGGPLKGIAEVAPVRGEGVVNARALLFRKSAAELQQYSYHFWADTPAAMLQRGLIDALRAAQAFDTVAAPEMRLNRDYEIMGTLRRLEHDLSDGDARAVLEVELGLRRVGDNTVMLLKTYAAELPVTGSGVPSVVAGLSAAFGDIVNRFVADLGRIPD
jgi:cholesterol transport system auxiliary component